jgi:hypothetical protein
MDIFSCNAFYTTDGLDLAVKRYITKASAAALSQTSRSLNEMGGINMFTRRFTLALGVVLAALLLCATPTLAGTRQPFQLSWTAYVPGYPQAGEISNPGGNYHERGFVNKVNFISTDPRMVG